MPAHNGFKCWIDIAGDTVREHKVEVDEDGVTIRCWIASELDKEFMVYWEDCVKELPTVGKLFIDGQHCDSPILREDNWDWPAICDTPYIDDRTGARLRFARIKVTDEEADAFQNHNIIKDIGNITVTISNIIIRGKATLVEQARDALGPIHETNVKAGVHHVEFGEAMTSYVDDTLMYDELGEPIVKFIFRYRPLDMLEAQGIYERSPTPESPDVKPNVKLEGSPAAGGSGTASSSAGPSGSTATGANGASHIGEDDEDEDDEDEEASQERIRKLEAELAAIRERKRRRDGDGGSPTKKVKREPTI